MTDMELLELIKADTGSYAELARRLGTAAGVRLDQEAICKWRERGQIAHSWRPWVLLLATRLGLTVSNEVALPKPNPWRLRGGRTPRARKRVPA